MIDKIDDGLRMEIVFKRRLTNEILTTYLPTTLLFLIVFATTKFKSFFFEAALTVNLTVMLVVTTLFIAVMERLPSTSYIRMVDVWLIFGQLLPFAEVVLLTYMEYLRDDETQEVNHHGKIMEYENEVTDITGKETDKNGKHITYLQTVGKFQSEVDDTLFSLFPVYQHWH